MEKSSSDFNNTQENEQLLRPKIPRGKIRTEAASFILCQKKDQAGIGSGNKLSLGGPGAEEEINKTFDILDLHGWELVNKLDLGCYDMPDLGAKILGMRTADHLASIKWLVLSFSRGYFVTDKAVETIAYNISRSSAKLKGLMISLDCGEKLTDDGVQILASEITSYQTHLTSLTLSFGGCQNLTNRALEAVTLSICKKLPQIKRLCLDFGNGPTIREDALVTFGSHISNLTGLDVLNLNLSMCPSGDKAMKVLSESILALKCMRRLFLIFDWCSGPTNEGLIPLLSNIFEHLPELRQLSFVLTWCKGINDEGLIGAVSKLPAKHASKLQRLNFNFEKCAGITAKGVGALLLAIAQNFTQLNQLYLNFSQCTLADEVLDIIGREFPIHLTQLRDLYIKFNFCGNMTEEKVEALRNDLKVNLPQTPEIEIRFVSASSTGKKTMMF